MKYRMDISPDVVSITLTENLLKKNLLKTLIAFFKLPDCFCTIYGINAPKEVAMKLQRINVFQHFIHCESKKTAAISVWISSNLLDDFARFLEKTSFDELTLWSKYTSWGNYIEGVEASPPFFTKPCKKQPMSPSFYLNYNVPQGKKVEIICDNILCKDVSFEGLSAFLDDK